MSRNAEAITIFCSRLCAADGVKPLEPREWSELAGKMLERDLQPEYLLDFERKDFTEQLGVTEEEAERYARLLDRSASLRFELSKYEDMGIRVITRADAEYPKMLKKKLGNGCPPLFYCAGDPSLLDKPAVGYVGSRAVDPTDLEFTKRIVARTAARGYAVVTGGAKGVDSISAVTAMNEGACVIEYLSDSMMRRMRDTGLVTEIRDGRVVLLSVVVPTAGFNVGVAMQRNRYIYAQSSGTVVVRSDKGKGGTWNGALENLKYQWCPTFCRDYDYPGNQELIRLGAIPVGDDWDGNIEEAEMPVMKEEKTKPKKEKAQQISLFD